MLNIGQEINRYVKDKSRFSCKGGGIMTDKELNSHDLTRELEIVKLQEDNEILKEFVQK